MCIPAKLEAMDAYHDRIAELARERIAIVPYNERWPQHYAEVEAKLVRSLPMDIVIRIAHIGSTAVPDLSAKPIVDVQVEVTSLHRVRKEVVPIMNDLGYEYVCRPTMGERAPFYAWFIARDANGERTEHVHMVEPDPASQDRILFRDHLRAQVEDARAYATLKAYLHRIHASDRAAYTQGKTEFVNALVLKARSSRP
jgi:GrpB-like predicted nucleotidyltransferase (UPF0157 family)